jgi:hypothetical protein
MKHTIEIFSDQIDDIIHAELVQLLDDYKYYLNEAKVFIALIKLLR